MTREEHLLTIIGEECSEVHKCCAKALRFGINDMEPEQMDTNGTRLISEFNDLIGAIELYFNTPVKNLINQSEISAKKIKIEKCLKYSEGCGTLTK